MWKAVRFLCRLCVRNAFFRHLLLFLIAFTQIVLWGARSSLTRQNNASKNEMRKMSIGWWAFIKVWCNYIRRRFNLPSHYESAVFCVLGKVFPFSNRRRSGCKKTRNIFCGIFFSKMWPTSASANFNTMSLINGKMRRCFLMTNSFDWGIWI